MNTYSNTVSTNSPAETNSKDGKEVCSNKENTTAGRTHNCETASEWLQKDKRRSRVTFADEDESDSETTGKRTRGSVGKGKGKYKDKGKGTCEAKGEGTCEDKGKGTCEDEGE